MNTEFYIPINLPEVTDFQSCLLIIVGAVVVWFVVWIILSWDGRDYD